MILHTKMKRRLRPKMIKNDMLWKSNMNMVSSIIPKMTKNVQ